MPILKMVNLFGRINKLPYSLSVVLCSLLDQCCPPVAIWGNNKFQTSMVKATV